MKMIEQKKQSRRLKNPNPLCINKITGNIEVLTQITVHNFEVFEALQKASCKKMEMGDFITYSTYDGLQIFDKTLTPKTFSNPDYFYIMDPEKMIILESQKNPKPIPFRIITSDDDFRTAIMFDSNARKGHVIVFERPESDYIKIISPSEFEENYTIVEQISNT
jgi:hypothetical protein